MHRFTAYAKAEFMKGCTRGFGALKLKSAFVGTTDDRLKRHVAHEQWSANR